MEMDEEKRSKSVVVVVVDWAVLVLVKKSEFSAPT